MEFSRPLGEGIFVKRYKRFFTDIESQGEVLVAHTANTGSLKGVAIGGQPCRYSHSDNPERKLKYTLEMIQAPTGAWVGVNTATPNTIVKEALEGAVAGEGFAFWQGYDGVKPEIKISAETRFDFGLLKAGKPQKYIEVKNVTLAENGLALFPDSVTERGQKHLRELT
ncbi:MAG: DNA/RNA nuclease SfsA, partial [Bdellovibrionia bacterium]